ncbi:MAG: HigA family addiction module antidote protein, partial [Nitrospirae bacterium]|nr:HigA family addiction module antidote protein [Nitrospirota bacterium]
VDRKTLSQLLNGHVGVSPTMAIRLAMATNTTPESWLNMQAAYDLWQAKRKAKRLKVEKLEVA